MPSENVLDIAALLAPVPGDDPAGTRLPLPIRQKLDALRKEFEPHPDDPAAPPVPKKPDWPTVKRLAEETLKTSKDLELAIRLTEALTRLAGFAGLRDGLHLLYELTVQCWDRLHPIPDEGEGMEVRAERFYWILEPDKGARFPHTIKGIPLAKAGGVTVSYQDVLAAMKGQGNISAADLEHAELLNPNVADDLAQCLTEVNQLEQILAEKCPSDPPAFTGLRQALDECQQFVHKVAASQPGTVAPESGTLPAGTANGPSASGGGAGNGTLPVVATRAEAYRQLAHIAGVLEQLEPHSPIPYLLRRAIDLGKMPFRQLLHELVREPNQLAEVRREFGIKEETPTNQEPS